MDFLDRLSDFIENRVELNSHVVWGKLSTSRKSVAIRPTPSSTISRSYDRGKTYEYSFQVLVKDPDQLITMRVLQDITDLLDGLPNSAITSEDGSFIFVKCEVYSYPSYLEETDHDEYIYTAMFTAELEGGK